MLHYVLQRNDFNPETPSIQKVNTLYYSLRPVIGIAQYFAIFPINGYSSSDASDLRFTWKSFKIFYWGLCFAGSVFFTLYKIFRLMAFGTNIIEAGSLMFFGTSSLRFLLFLKLARSWPDFAVFWQQMELDLAAKNTVMSMIRPNEWSLALKFKIITFTLLGTTFVEHCMYVIEDAYSFLKMSSSDTLISYFGSQFIGVVHYEIPAFILGITIRIISFICTMGWSFGDLFIILMCTALNKQFELLNDRINIVVGKNFLVDKKMPKWWWSNARMDYCRLSTMTQQLDYHISGVILLSFLLNLYSICIQLFNSFKPKPDTLKTAFFMFSFGFLLTKTLMVSLYAANIHTSSRLPASVLYNVPDECYSKEVELFLHQVTTDHVCLTGMKFFFVTRSLILTVTSTIITYEIILMQFNSIQGDD